MTEKNRTKSSKEKGAQLSHSHAPALPQQSNLPSPQGHILDLQRTIGNRAVSQLLQSSVNGSSDTNVQKQVESAPSRSADAQSQEQDSSGELFSRAYAESGQPLAENVRVPLERHLGVSLSGVRVHSGPDSEAAAENIGARAYTIGTSIHLGPDASRASAQERDRLLMHEAVHTVQQGGQPVALQGKMQVSHPSDNAEVEADHIAEKVMSASRAPSPTLALRNQLRATPIAPHTVSRVAAPLIQRDLKGDHRIDEGKFTLDLTTESHPGARSGMSGTIKFNANDKAPDSTEIKLLQVVRNENLTTGKEYVWTGDDADRNKMMTAKAPGVDPGFHVDVLHTPGKPAPRKKKKDAPVSPYYRDYAPNPPSQNGSKKGKVVTEASLWDSPSSAGNRRYSFETVAKATDTGHVYGTVMWGFTISDASKGKVEKEHAVGRNVTLLTTDKAIEKFNEFYRNPGAKTAPKK
jgi:hypothetical protein